MVTAGKDGKWMTFIKTPPAGGPYEIKIEVENTIRLENVMSGEVWICSGQSNMHFALKGSLHAKEEIPVANYSK